jgi:hypothetical protein
MQSATTSIESIESVTLDPPRVSAGKATQYMVEGGASLG